MNDDFFKPHLISLVWKQLSHFSSPVDTFGLLYHVRGRFQRQDYPNCILLPVGK